MKERLKNQSAGWPQYRLVRGWRTKIRVNGLLGSVLFLFAIIICAQLVVSNILSGEGGELERLEREKVQVLRENRILAEELSESLSLLRVSGESPRLGLVKPKSIIYLDLAEPLAALPRDGSNLARVPQ